MEYLYEMNKKLQMVRYAPVPWPNCSPEFKLLVCYLLGYLKSCGVRQRSSVNKTSSRTNSVTEIAADIRIEMAARWPLLSKPGRFEILLLVKSHNDTNKC